MAPFRFRTFFLALSRKEDDDMDVIGFMVMCGIFYILFIRDKRK